MDAEVKQDDEQRQLSARVTELQREVANLKNNSASAATLAASMLVMVFGVLGIGFGFSDWLRGQDSKIAAIEKMLPKGGKHLDEHYASPGALRLLEDRAANSFLAASNETRLLEHKFKMLGYVVNNYAKTGFYLSRNGKFSGLPDHLELTEEDKTFVNSNLAEGVTPYQTKVKEDVR